MNLETKIAIYKFTPQVFTLTHKIPQIVTLTPDPVFKLDPKCFSYVSVRKEEILVNF